MGTPLVNAFQHGASKRAISLPTLSRRHSGRSHRSRYQSPAQVFIDDVVIHSETRDQYLRSIATDIKRRHENGLLYRLVANGVGDNNATLFELRTTTRENTAIWPKLTKAIEEFPHPSTAKQVLSYLGTRIFTRHYIPNFAHNSSPPLYALITRKRKMNVSVKGQGALDGAKWGIFAIKKYLCSSHAWPNQTCAYRRQWNNIRRSLHARKRITRGITRPSTMPIDSLRKLWLYETTLRW